MARGEQDLAAGALTGGGGFSTGRRRTVAGTLAAKVTTEGVARLTREFTGLWNVLKNVRSELGQINKLSRGGGGGGMGGVGQGTSTGAAGSQVAAMGRGDAGVIDIGGLMGRVVNRYAGATPAAGTGGGGYSVGNLPQSPGGAPGTLFPPPPGGPATVGGPPGPPVASVRGPGGFNYGKFTKWSAIGTAAQVAEAGLGVIEDRFQRNVIQSAPISSQDVLTASMYGTPYRGAETARYGAAGAYAGRRESVLGAEQIALGLGARPESVRAPGGFLAAAGNIVQASGGTLDLAQAASTSALFASPQVSNRARGLGMLTYKQNGVLQNPQEVALGYIKQLEKRGNFVMNEIDFSNLRSPGSALRLQMKQIFGLSDEAIDVVVQAGMQNLQFRTKTGGGRDINFGSSKDIGQIVDSSALGMTAARFGTAQQRREATFFGQQEGAMTGRLEQETNLQEILEKTETAFGDLLGPMHEFERYLKGITTVLGLLAAGGMARALMGGGGGGGGGLLANLLSGGAPGAGAPGAGVPGATAPAAGGLLRAAAPAAAVAVGGVVAAKGIQMAGGATNKGDIAESALTTAAGAATIGAGIGLAGGPFAPITVPAGAVVGGTIGLVTGTAVSAKSYFKNVDRKKVKDGYDEGVGLDDEKLIESMGDYVHNASPGGRTKGQGAGPKQRGRHDAFARRRGALLAAALTEGQLSGQIKTTGTGETTDLGELVNFFSSDEVWDDNKLWSNKNRAKRFSDQLIGSPIWRKYFGDVIDPFAYQPVTTEQSKNLVQTQAQVFSSTTGVQAPTQGPAAAAAASGDGSFAATENGSIFAPRDITSDGMGLEKARRPSGTDPFPGGGDPISDKAEGMGETWSKLDPRMKDRLLKMFRASGGKVWLGGGWRSTEVQRQMFLSRYTPDPNGSISWDGKKWRHTSGAPAAPPGRSMHEIGMAADLAGDTGWVGAHGGEFGLKDFSDVNGEPWHVQLTEFPNSRTEYEKTGDKPGGGGGDTGGGAATAAPATPQPFASGSGSSFSGIGYSIATAALSIQAPGGVSATPPTAAGGAGGGVGGGGGPGWTGAWPTEEMERGAATAKVAAAAGFAGQDLTNMVAISFRESGWKTDTWVIDNDDVGGGLWAINQLPWLRKGLKPPWTKEEIQNPTRAAQIAKELFDQRGYQPWTTAGGAMARTDQAHALAAVQKAGLGDGPFDTGMSSRSMSFSGPESAPAANVNITVQITSTGSARYDAQALGEAVRPVLSNVMAEISTKRGS